MRRVVPRSQLVGLLDIVRTRILEFALEIERMDPHAGDVRAGGASLSMEKVHHVYNTTILGDGSNVAISSPGSLQFNSQVKKGDWQSLADALMRAGVPENALVSFKRASE